MKKDQTKHTINLKKEEIRIVKVVQAVKDLSSIDKSIAFIINDYVDTKSYSKFIKEHKKRK